VSDVPQADAQEQAEEVEPDAMEPRNADPDAISIPDDVPEADAIEQAEVVPDHEQH
jgi:hypothetical protein